MRHKKAKPASPLPAEPTSTLASTSTQPPPQQPLFANKTNASFMTGRRTLGQKPAKGKHEVKREVMDTSVLAEPEAATVHECVGAALLMLPANLRGILGDKDLCGSALELETKEILVVVREAGVVAYVHLPILVKEIEEIKDKKRPVTGLQDGLVLLDITGSFSKKAAKRSNADAKERAKPKPKTKPKAAKPQASEGSSDHA